MKFKKKINSRILFCHYVLNILMDNPVDIYDLLKIEDLDITEIEPIFLELMKKNYIHDKINQLRQLHHQPIEIGKIETAIINTAITESFIEKESKMIISNYLNISVFFEVKTDFINGVLDSYFYKKTKN